MTTHAPHPTLAHWSDETAVRALYVHLMDGWNAGSGALFAAPFADDADLVGFDGTHLRGREEIETFHQQLFDTYVKGSRLVGKITGVRFLAADVALMHAVGGTAPAGALDLAPDRNSVQTMVAVRDGAVWRLAAFQNTRAQFMGRPEAAEALTEELRRLLR
jgi:uncharacterized protein (TIGR02246 family)